jgi:hypothetical protein
MKAFPQKYPEDASSPHHFIRNPVDTGMDLRDYFAAEVLSCIAIDETNIHSSADFCYKVADAMMKAREK